MDRTVIIIALATSIINLASAIINIKKAKSDDK